MNYRLSANVKPLKYQIKTQPNLADFTFVASEIVSLQITKPTKNLVLHAVEINIQSAKVVVGKNSFEAKISYQVKAETVTFSFSKAISGKAKLYIDFAGIIGEQLRGLYRSKYIHKKEEKFLAVSQFEATDARRFMPCFDEPGSKAEFHLEVIVPDHLAVVSNTIEKSITPHEPGLKIIKFEATPKMSTYLLALIIGELEYLEGKSKRGVKIRVYTTPGKKLQGKFALEFSKKALDYLEKYFGINYPMPVLDLLAIPDFSAGAMENWGAITFRETVLLVDETNSPFSQKQRVAEVIAHELVHQWFGNLVTMEWWTHLWLNESFATYMAYLVVDHIFPEWNYWTKFALDEQAFALQQDSLHSTHPIEVEVKHPDEISEIFDAISYAKGATVLRMLSLFIGAENFQKGLSYYLKKHSYKNTSSIHLWEAFEKISGQPVRKIMKTWTTVSGFPVLSVKFKHQSLELIQEEFKQLNKGKTKQLWPIPLTIQTDDSRATTPLLLEKQRTIVAVESSSKYINLDYEDGSPTVIHYDVALLSSLLPKLRNKTLGVLDRLALVRDSFLLAKSGRLPTELYLEVVQFLDKEISFVVWSEVHRNVSQLRKMLHGTTEQDKFRKFTESIFSQILFSKEVGLTHKSNQSQNISLVRSIAYQEAGMSGNNKVIADSKKLFKQLLSGKNIDPNLKAAMLTVTAKFGTKAEVGKIIELFKATDSAVFQQQLLFALINGCQKRDQRQLFDFVYSDFIRSQDQAFAISATLANPELKKEAWKQVVKHWPMIEKKYSSTKMAGIVFSGANSFNNSEEYNQFKAFLKGKKLPGAKQSISQTNEKIEINLAWKQKDLLNIKRYFKA